jgi:hypothetical protein
VLSEPTWVAEQYRHPANLTALSHLHELKHLASRFGPIEVMQPPEFNLEHGRDALEPWFASITLDRYEDSLVVTEAEPLSAHLLSGRSKASLSEDAVRVLSAHLEHELAINGTIQITKDSGLFQATRP